MTYAPIPHVHYCTHCGIHVSCSDHCDERTPAGVCHELAVSTPETCDGCNDPCAELRAELARATTRYDFLREQFGHLTERLGLAMVEGHKAGCTTSEFPHELIAELAAQRNAALAEAVKLRSELATEQSQRIHLARASRQTDKQRDDAWNTLYNERRAHVETRAALAALVAEMAHPVQQYANALRALAKGKE